MKQGPICHLWHVWYLMGDNAWLSGANDSDKTIDAIAQIRAQHFRGPVAEVRVGCPDRRIICYVLCGADRETGMLKTFTYKDNAFHVMHGTYC